jgi:hypothetical protein
VTDRITLLVETANGERIAHSMRRADCGTYLDHYTGHTGDFAATCRITLLAEGERRGKVVHDSVEVLTRKPNGRERAEYGWEAVDATFNGIGTCELCGHTDAVWQEHEYDRDLCQRCFKRNARD